MVFCVGIQTVITDRTGKAQDERIGHVLVLIIRNRNGRQLLQ